LIDSGPRGCAIWVQGTTENVLTVKNNLYVAPDLNVGPYTASALRVTGRNDMLNFTRLSAGGGVEGNVWPLPAGAYAHGVNYVCDRPWGDKAYRTPAEWARDFPEQVGSDRFLRVLGRDLDPLTMSPAPDSRVAHSARPVPGVFADLHGRDFPVDGIWSAGAVQPTESA
jgi:hypothetical protein